MMPAHYIPLRALRLCCRYISKRIYRAQIPVVVSRSVRGDHGCIVLLERVKE